jgi:hypothetical protein
LHIKFWREEKRPAESPRVDINVNIKIHKSGGHGGDEF